ncbi:MAG: hypothetical protein SFU56_00740 [Capsulimonadales bacterium]|nr:hypothetical protein [Capsulimonadales bacterium]
MPVNLVTIGVFNTEIEASLYLMRLRDADIFATLSNTAYHQVSGAIFGAVPGFQGIWVQVREEDAERAEAILRLPPPAIDEDALAAAAEAATSDDV